MIKTTYVCDQCGNEVKGNLAENWIRVEPLGRHLITFSGVFTASPIVTGVYCSNRCLADKIAVRESEARDYMDMVLKTAL